METQMHAFENLGYGQLKKRYGVNYINIWQRPFEEVDLGDDVVVKFNTDIKEMIAVKGCPPKPEAVCEALHKAGIDVDPAIFENLDTLPGIFLKRYEGRPEFDESFFKI
jgi:coenzyme F420-reducing hydrogenase gamma subunit